MDSKIRFNTKYSRLRYYNKDLDGKVRKSRVDLTGFIPREKRIKALIEAGEMLRPQHLGKFDFEDEVDISDYEPDPTRSGSFDLADASAIKNSLESKAKKTDSRKKASQTVQEGPGSVSRSEPGQLTPEGSKAEPGSAPKELLK